MAKLEALEMKSRVQVIRDELRRQLPEDFSKALPLLLLSAQNEKLKGFDFWPYTEFVQTYGLDHPNISLNALKELTKVFTSEWAVRPFIKLYPDITMTFLELCSQDKDVKVRRWASEGSRPRLPWGERLQDFIHDPLPTFPILETLKYDPELFVRKSVANHMNDIAKDHPNYVVNILNRWKSEACDDDLPKIEWTIKQSLRTLIKNGHPDAFKLIGAAGVKIEINNFKIKQKKIRLGERLDFEMEIHSKATQDQKLVIDYIVHFMKANNKTTAKVFKLKTVQLPPKGILKIEKSHHLKKITTREYYPGLHRLQLQINGVASNNQEWILDI